MVRLASDDFGFFFCFFLPSFLPSFWVNMIFRLRLLTPGANRGDLEAQEKKNNEDVRYKHVLNEDTLFLCVLETRVEGGFVLFQVKGGVLV